MKNWFDIIPPHEDIRRGNFDEAVFAADLGDVAAGTARPDYNDPYLFFKKTFLTQGLHSLLRRVHEKLTTGHGASVVEIQTPFGGGKTHALVAIYHYLQNGQRIQELLPSELKLISPAITVIAGNHWNPIEGRTTDGVTRHTFWGELAYQLGGRDGYEQFRANDEARVSPGKEKLRAFLEAQQPFILLFDEILEYINRALDVRGQMEGSLGTQSFSFFQELTEAVSSLARGMLVVTLPKSDLEDFGDQQAQSLARLNKIFGRVESIETPVQGEEVFAVIRRRLFDVEALRAREMREVVYRYFQSYQKHHEDLPSKVRDVDYRDKMELAFPFHPDVIDILYEKWSTYPTFQRTRGVLRLLANVVEDLYHREANLDLILPGDINLASGAIRQEFLKHIGWEYEGIIGSDIAGHEAKAQQLDSANRQWKHLAERVATVIFFHSFSAGESARDISLPHVKLGTMRSDTIPAMVTDVLQRLATGLWYLNQRGSDAYYFSDVPNINRMILDKKELFSDSYERRMREVIQEQTGDRLAAYVWPESVEGVPDNRDLKLVVLPPEEDGGQIPHWLQKRGSTFREYPNTLFFALADTGAFVKLREEVKTLLALEDIESEIRQGEHPSLEAKRGEIQQRLHGIRRDFSYNVRRMYHTLRFGEREVDLGQPVTGNESLSHWYWRELTSSDVGAISTQLHYRFLNSKFLTGNMQVATSAILDQFYKNLELPVPESAGVVARAIQLGVQEVAFGLVTTSDGQLDLDTLRFGEALAFDAIAFEPEVLLLHRDRAAGLQAEREEVVNGENTLAASGGEQVDEMRSGAREATRIAEPPAGAYEVHAAALKETRYQRVRLVVAGVPANKIADAHRGILQPLSQVTDDLTFTLTLDVASEEGISEATLENKIKETIRQIGARLVEEVKE